MFSVYKIKNLLKIIKNNSNKIFKNKKKKHATRLKKKLGKE